MNTDFLAILPDKRQVLVQVCEELSNETTKAREIRALTAAMEETGARHAWILTDNEVDDIPVSCGTVHCIPAPHFLMREELPKG